MRSLDDTSSPDTTAAPARVRLKYALWLFIAVSITILGCLTLFQRISKSKIVYADLKGQSLDTYTKDGIASSEFDQFHLLDFKGTRVVIFIQEGCPHCATLLGDLNQKLTTRDRSHLVLLSIRKESNDTLPANLPVGVAFGPGDRLARALHITTTPVTIVVDGDHRIKATFVGDDPSVSARILRLLHDKSNMETVPLQSIEKPCNACRVN